MVAKAQKIETDAGKTGQKDALNLSTILGIERRTRSANQPGPAANTQAGYGDTTRWPLWRTSLLVIGFCSIFWICTIALVLALLG